MAMEWRERDGIRWLEAVLPTAKAVFSTRLGGVSRAPFDSLNLGILTGDDPARVLTNRTRLCAALGLRPAGVLMGLQVHGSELVAHESEQDPSPYVQPGSPLPEADGHFISTSGLAPLVLVADCLPVALSGPPGAAMLHCGWRGLAAGIVSSGVEMVRAEAAAIGPGIGPCCYQVGPEVLEQFASLPGAANGAMLDLAEVIRRQLAAAGVDRIESAGLCTSCEDSLFFSHRRDGEYSGRQGALVWVEGDG
jgi:YfiH family protein